MNKQLKTILLITIFASVVLLYHFMGNTADIHLFGRSVFYWMIRRWGDYGGQYSHCWLIPFISAGILWWRRIQIMNAGKRVDARGLIFIALCLLLLLVSARTRLPRLSLLSFIGLTWSIPFYLYGPQVAKILVFPCAYLLFCIPLTFLDSLTFPLRIFAASASVFLLNGLGIRVLQVGTAIYFPGVESFGLDVADPCSGLRYFLVMLSLAAVYGYVTQKTLFKKWLFFLLAGPLAVIANIVRIMVISVAARVWGSGIAENIYHNLSGCIVFIAAVLLMIGLGTLLNIKVGTLKRNTVRDKHTTHPRPSDDGHPSNGGD